MDLSKLHLSESDRKALEAAQAVKPVGAISTKRLMPLKQIKQKNDGLVRRAVAKIADCDGYQWNGELLDLGDQIGVIVKKGQNDIAFKIWTVDVTPVVYYLIPVSEGDYSGTGVNTAGEVSCRMGRRNGQICRVNDKPVK